MPGKHCNYAPSSAHRWLACPGCVKLAASLPAGESSEYAREGTAAHALGEDILDNTGFIKDTYSGVKVTDEMRKAVNVYVDYVRGVVNENVDGRHLDLEVRGEIYFDEVRVYGTADACVVEDWGTLEVIDYKHGQGKVVEVEDNPQLMLYALMAYQRYTDREISDVKITVVQPRAPHKAGPVRSCTYTLEDLTDWYDTFKNAVRMCETQSDLYIPGRHCHWCRGADQHACPALQEQTQELAKAEFSTIGTLEREDIKRILDAEKVIVNYIKKLKERVAEEGLEIDGWKPVQGYGHRKWNDKDAVIKKLKGRKFKASEIYEKKLISPSKAIEKFGEPYRQFIEDLSTRKPTRMLLVPTDAGDKKAKDEF